MMNMKPKLSDSAQLLLSYVVPWQIRRLQGAKDGEDPKPTITALLYRTPSVGL